MNKAEFIEKIADCFSSKAEAERALQAVLNGVTDVLTAGDSVTFVGFGTFKTRKRAARVGRNPQTGKELNIEAATVPAFTAGKGLKDAVNKKAKKS